MQSKHFKIRRSTIYSTSIASHVAERAAIIVMAVMIAWYTSASRVHNAPRRCDVPRRAFSALYQTYICTVAQVNLGRATVLVVPSRVKVKRCGMDSA